MASPMIAQKGPYGVEVRAGKLYFWCACGRSRKQPFCDDSHKGTEFSPIEYRPKETGTVWFCGCKHSGTKPICDGTHKRI